MRVRRGGVFPRDGSVDGSAGTSIGPAHEDRTVGDDVGHAARQGTLWGVIAQTVQQGLSVVATLILARLLTPADFGVVTAAVTVLAFVQLALALGWGTAIVRRLEVDDAYLSSIFWVIVGMGLTIAAAVSLGAPVLAGLIGVSGVGPYLAVLGLTSIPGAALVVPQALLQRRLELKTVHVISIVSVVVYVAVQVGLALVGAGAWAVIIGLVTQALVLCAGAFIAARWRPRLIFRPALIGEDFRFASGLLFYNGLNYGVRNADYWVVGRVLGAPALGAYYVAYVLPQIVRLRVTWVAGSVLYPVLARLRSDQERTRQVYNHTVLLQAWIGFPAMVGLAALSEPVVHVFFGPKWDTAVGPLRWLAFVALLEFITFAPPMVAQVQGRLRALLVSNIVRLVLLVVGVAAAGIAFRSLEAVAAGVFFATLLFAVYQQFALARPLGLGFAPLVKGLASIALLSAGMAVAVGLVLEQIDGWAPIVQVMTCTGVGAVLYLALGRLLFRGVTAPLVHSVLTMVRSRRRATIASASQEPQRSGI
jgi:O-antigen/teichoic acid export membrane protein